MEQLGKGDQELASLIVDFHGPARPLLGARLRTNPDVASEMHGVSSSTFKAGEVHGTGVDRGAGMLSSTEDGARHNESQGLLVRAVPSPDALSKCRLPPET